MSVVDAKNAKRYKADSRAWAKIREHFAGETCWVCDGPWSELHHVLPRSGGGPWPTGDDLTVNLAPLCAECHRKIEARDPLARSALRSALMPSNLAYLVFRLRGADKAQAFLDRQYARVAA